MLDAFDVLVFDIQDVGARFYTYLYSLSYAMEACARGGKEVVVLDRVNPLGGVKRTGTILDLRFSSFVGDYELPTQYALTIGEYGPLCEGLPAPGCEAHGGAPGRVAPGDVPGRYGPALGCPFAQLPRFGRFPVLYGYLHF